MVDPVSHLPSLPNTGGKGALFLALTVLITSILGFRRAQAPPPPSIAPSSVSMTPQTTPQLTVFEQLINKHNALHKQAMNCSKLPKKYKKALRAELKKVERQLKEFNT